MPKAEEKKDEVERLDEDTQLGIVAELDIDTIQLKKKRWYIRLMIEDILPRTYHGYSMSIDFNEEPYEDRIEELRRENDETLFKDDPKQQKALDKKIRQIQDKLTRLRGECEQITFTATVEEVKYKGSGTLVLLRVPDDVIEAFNRQKHHMNLYLVTLSPLGI